MSFLCPRCGAVSHNPNDAAHRYCGRCHVFVGDNDEHLDGIAKRKGPRLEQITVEPNEGAPDGYAWGAWASRIPCRYRRASARPSPTLSSARRATRSSTTP